MTTNSIRKMLESREAKRADAVHIQYESLAVELGISPQSVSKARRGETIAYRPAAGLFSGLIQQGGMRA
ncbi:MAG: hypothetical protein LBI66_09855 [Burkholderiaceae bacterium]|jgi:hypothetical protein|nr:hypothetical protein [Burkholderiaceae bacterium]